MFLTGLGVPGESQTLLKTANLGAGFSPFASVTADASGMWQYADTNALAFLKGFYGLSYP
ncbi:MAG TPA: hypothetical protein VH619_00855 [Verrucomicrobiae bacterium]|nr:hypothetical protein [Verrucomicrobiae bacterium]